MEMSVKHYKIASIPMGFINQRFFVKSSVMEIEGFTPSVIVFVYDIVEDTPKLRYFSNEDRAVDFINLLKAAY